MWLGVFEVGPSAPSLLLPNTEPQNSLSVTAVPPAKNTTPARELNCTTSTCSEAQPPTTIGCAYPELYIHRISQLLVLLLEQLNSSRPCETFTPRSLTHHGVPAERRRLPTASNVATKATSYGRRGSESNAQTGRVSGRPLTESVGSALCH